MSKRRSCPPGYVTVPRSLRVPPGTIVWWHGALRTVDCYFGLPHIGIGKVALIRPDAIEKINWVYVEQILLDSETLQQLQATAKETHATDPLS